MPEKTDKPWGYEELLASHEQYVLKRLFMKEGHCCSLQYHEFKHETIYVVSGTLRVSIGEHPACDELSLTSGGFISIPPFTVHRMCGITDCVYLEASTNHLTDVIRIQDNYGRV